MAYTAKIIKVKQEISLENNTPYLDVLFHLFDENGENVAERRHAFPLDTPEEKIIAEVKEYCVMYQNDTETAAKAEAESKLRAEADEKINKLEGVEIGTDEEAEAPKRNKK